MILCEATTKEGLSCGREAVHDMTIKRFGEERQIMVCQPCAERIEQEQESEEDDY